MNRFTLVCVAALLLCAAAPAGEKDKAEPKQGVDVMVVKLKGNFMPGPGAGNRGGLKTPLQVPVHVFKGKVRPFAKPDPKHAQLVATVKTDKQGKARIPVAPGTYTVVAAIDGKMYLNIQTFEHGKAYWASVEVKDGEFTRWMIEDTSDAAF